MRTIHHVIHAFFLVQHGVAPTKLQDNVRVYRFERISSGMNQRSIDQLFRNGNGSAV